MLQVGKKGTMIDVIITTRDEDIARKVSTNNEPYKLQHLEVDTCWEIIKIYSKFEDKNNQETLEQIGRDIAKKCGGVALAAQALGYMLQSKDLDGWIEINSSDIWNEPSEDNGGVLPSLKLSYERMQPQLRICFSYCAIFPKGHNISEDDLIHQWIALGFIKASKGKQYIRKLLGMSFLQASKLPMTSRDHMAWYTMHDLVHDLATLTIGDELTVSSVTSKRNNIHSQKYCRYALVTRYDQEKQLSDVLSWKVRALHFSDSDRLDLCWGAFSFAKCLHILDFSGCSSILLPNSIGQLKQLKYLVAPRMENEGIPKYITEQTKLQYLNLNGSSYISGLPESISKLGSLRYLGLSGCSGISKLPESLGNLTNLLRLDLSGCSRVKVIPESLCGLTQLQHLDISSCRCVAQLPQGIGSLVDLQHLNMSRCGVKELPKSFKRLRSLLHLDLRDCYTEKGLAEALRGLTALQYLDMSAYNGARKLETKDDLPSAMRNLTKLKVLDLSHYTIYVLFGVGKDNDYLHFIGALTNLEHLDISWNVLEHLPESIGNLKRLHTLNVKFCHKLKSLPQSIGGATRLKSILLDGCSRKVMDQAISLLHHSLTLPLFKVHADDISSHSNLHLLEGENVDELHIVSLENVRFVEEAKRLKLLTKQNLLSLKLAWTSDGNRHLEDKDLLGQLVPPMSLKYLTVEGYSSPSFPSWLMAISHHLPNLTRILLTSMPGCSNLPPLGQLQNLESLCLWSLPLVTKIDKGICGGKRAFHRLVKFTLAFMEGLEECITTYPGEDGVEEFMFPVLDKFEVSCCPRLGFKPCPPKCRQCIIESSDKVISSLEIQTSSPRCNTSLAIKNSRRHSFRLFHHFPALQELKFEACENLMSLPEGIQQLSYLQSLELDRCHSISALPEWLNNISSLKKLVFRSCASIRSLPACIQLLTNLKDLVIDRNPELRQWCDSEENKGKLAHINIMFVDG